MQSSAATCEPGPSRFRDIPYLNLTRSNYREEATPFTMFKCIPLFKGCNRQVYNCITLMNPFISITPSKPIMSSWIWLTLHNCCEIYYLSAVNYDLATTVQYLPRARDGGLQLILTHLCYQGTIYSVILPYNIGRGEGAYCQFFNLFIFSWSPCGPTALPHYISSGRYSPCKIYCFVLACINAFNHIELLP